MGFFFFLLLVVLSGCVLWGCLWERFHYQFNRYRLTLKKSLPHPLRILHLSDIHFSAEIPALTRFFEVLAADAFDFIFITGDIMDDESGIPQAAECLRKLKSSFGIFAVFGNHDYLDYRLTDMFLHNFPGQKQPQKRHGDHLLQKALEEAGVRILNNATAEVECYGHKVLIHGLDDPTTGRANVRMAMKNFDPSKLNLLLTHAIDALLDIGDNEIDVAFSGHSHGGQIRLPWIGPIVTHTMIGRAYASGIKRLKGTICSISRGVGTSRFLKFRFLCPPEAIIVTLAEGEGEILEEDEKKPVL